MHEALSAEKINYIAMGPWPVVVLQSEADNEIESCLCRSYGQEKSNSNLQQV